MFQCFSMNSIQLSRPCGKKQYRIKYLENIRTLDQYAHQRENSIEKKKKLLRTKRNLDYQLSFLI